jgi:hypothetical protein
MKLRRAVAVDPAKRLRSMKSKPMRFVDRCFGCQGQTSLVETSSQR